MDMEHRQEEKERLVPRVVSCFSDRKYRTKSHDSALLLVLCKTFKICVFS